MKPALWLAATLVLAGCDGRDTQRRAGSGAELPPLRLPPIARAANPPAPLGPPLNPARARGVQISFRSRDGEEDHDAIDILSLEGEEKDGRPVLTRIRARSEAQERERSFAISRLTLLTPAGGEQITGRAAIMLWLRDLAGMATEADREAAGLEAADRVAEEEAEYGAPEEIAARKLRVPAWLDYTDSDGSTTRRRITITSMHGEQDDEIGWDLWRVEAYCHLRRAARTFLVDRMVGIAESAQALGAMELDDINAWLGQRAKKPPRERRSRGGEAPHG